MDRIYRRQRHVYDFTRKYYPAWPRSHDPGAQSPRPGDRVLEIGCGTGRNLILAARLYPQTHIYGIDVSTEMLRSAREAIARAG